MPLVLLGIVVINVVVDDSFHRFEVVSGLQLFAFQDLNKAMAGILSSLIGMDDGFLIEGYRMIANKVVDGLKNEVNLRFYTSHFFN